MQSTYPGEQPWLHAFYERKNKTFSTEGAEVLFFYIRAEKSTSVRLGHRKSVL